MKVDHLNDAVANARRFIARAEKCKPLAGAAFEFIEPGAQAAAAKRASLDLSRALSTLRKSDYK